MSTADQNFTLPSAGQADWDSDLNGNFTIIARGYHTLGTAGEDISTGQIVTVGSDDLFRIYDPNSTANQPFALSYKAINSGEQDTFLLRGMVRSLGVFTPAIPGHVLFGSAATPGTVATSYSGANRPIGFATYEDAVFFDPGRQIFPEVIVRTETINAVTGSSHLFSFDGGLSGYVRQVIMIGNSADLVTLQLWSNSSRNGPLYEVISGGVTTVGSYLDQAGLPFFNTDASTINGLMYGTLEVMSAAAVGSDTVNVSVVFERFR